MYIDDGTIAHAASARGGAAQADQAACIAGAEQTSARSIWRRRRGALPVGTARLQRRSAMRIRRSCAFRRPRRGGRRHLGLGAGHRLAGQPASAAQARAQAPCIRACRRAWTRRVSTWCADFLANARSPTVRAVFGAAYVGARIKFWRAATPVFDDRPVMSCAVALPMSPCRQAAGASALDR